MREFRRLALSAAIGALALSASATEVELSAAHGYVETTNGAVGASGINIPGENRDANGRPELNNSLTSWTDGNACAVYYFHNPATTVAHSIKLNVKTLRTTKFRLTITDPDMPGNVLQTFEFSVFGSGSEKTVTIGDATFPRSAYYRYKLECTSGNSNINSIKSFVLSSSASEASYAANYLSSPSVHLNTWRSSSTAAPSGDAYDWCFEEIMIPEESDITGTYAEAIGALNGYMGIQMNGYYDDGTPCHDVLFSMWDDGSTDEDPNLPEYLRAGAIDHDPLTIVNRFGNEGTGVQTYRKGNYWTPGRYVQFITNCRPETTSYTTTANGQTTVHEQHNMLVSTWFNALDGKGWQYMATVRKRNSSTYFSSWYSFLENYNTATGQASRKAYYRNGYARSRQDGKWYNFNKVGFGHTDGGSETGARSDYGQGATDQASERTFFMQTGGYTSTKTAASSVTLATDNTPVDTINIAPLEQRVQLAIANEKRRADEDEHFANYIIGKDGWTIVSCSSEETSGEGDNGRAQLIIDGNDNTYWHPQWQSSVAQLPHTLVVDMKAVKSVGGFLIKMGGASNRYIKAYDIYGSTDNSSWTKLCSDDKAPVKSEFKALLDEAVNIRYFKIVIRETTADDGPFVRIYEVEVASGDVLIEPAEPDEFEGKFKYDFESGNSLPEGSYAEDGWAITQRDDAGTSNVYLLANNNMGADNKFVLPLMKVGNGERMAVDVCRTNYYYGGDNVYLNVYYSSDRKNWTLVKKVKGSELSATRAVNHLYRFGNQQIVYIDNIPAGNYYIAFGAGYTAIDNIRGFEKVNVSHDWVITATDIPSSGKENYLYTASATLRNMSATTETAGSYTAKLYVGGQAVATAESTELASGAEHTFNFSYTPHEAGTRTAYIEFKHTASGYIVQSDATTVNIEEETDNALVKVGEGTETTTYAPIYWIQADNNKTSYAAKRGGYADILFRPERLAKYGLSTGTKITAIVLRGTASAAKTFTRLVLEARVKQMSANGFTPGENIDDATPIYIYDYDHTYDADSHADELFKTTAGGEVTTTITLPSPIVWDGKSAIRLYTHVYASEYASVNYVVDADASDRSCFYRTGKNDTFSDMSVPVAYFAISNEASTLSGKVTYDAQPVAGAVVRLHNDEVEYEATTDATGDYSISVTRSDLRYTLSVTAPGYAPYTEEQPIEIAGDMVKNINLNVATAINGISLDDNANTPLYNLSGQQQNRQQGGIVVTKGKKFVVKSFSVK